MQSLLLWLLMMFLIILVFADTVIYFILYLYLRKEYNEGKDFRTSIDVWKSAFMYLHPEDETYRTLVVVYRIAYGVTFLLILGGLVFQLFQIP